MLPRGWSYVKLVFQQVKTTIKIKLMIHPKLLLHSGNHIFYFISCVSFFHSFCVFLLSCSTENASFLLYVCVVTPPVPAFLGKRKFLSFWVHLWMLLRILIQKKLGFFFMIRTAIPLKSSLASTLVIASHNMNFGLPKASTLIICLMRIA